MTDIALAPVRHNALLTWLRYDSDRVPEVEAAYDAFIGRSRYGIAILVSIVVTLVAAFIIVSGNPGAPVGLFAGPMLIAGTFGFYGIQLLCLVGVPRATLAQVLAGAVDGRRAAIFGLGAGLLIALLEYGLVVLLESVGLRDHGRSIDPMTVGVAFGFFSTVVAAPIAEEFMMQGWLQTRLRGLGPGPAATVTTIVFLAIHLPSSVLGSVRALVLGALAGVRATTRSLGAAIAMHAANNLFFGALIVLDRYAFHHK